MKELGVITSPITGEYLGEINPGDRITRAKSIEYLKRNKILVNGPETVKQFFKGNAKEIEKIMNSLDTFERSMLFSISVYVSYTDCCLKYGNGTNITTDDIVTIAGMSRGKTFQVIDNLIKKDILYKGKNSKNRQYFVNPWIFCKGNRVNTVLQTMFQNYKIQSLGGIRWKDLTD